MGEMFSNIVMLGGLVLPAVGWIGLFVCKFIVHKGGCDNKGCWYRCSKCPYLQSEEYNIRIAVLEQAQAKNPTGKRAAYIQFLKKRMQTYLDNPQMDRETPEQTLLREIREKG